MENSEKIRTKELAIWLILPGLILNLSLGFLFTLILKGSLLEIKSVEIGDLYFKIFRIWLLVAFVFGFFLERNFRFAQRKSVKFLLFCLIFFEIIWNYTFTSNEFIVDYIFHRFIFYFFFTVNCFTIGYLVSSFKSFRIWSFLAGTLIFIFYSILYNSGGINTKDYLFPFLVVLSMKLIMKIFFHDYGVLFEQKKLNDRNSYSAFFYSGVILFSSHIVLVFIAPSENLNSFFIGISSSALLFSVLSYFGLLHKEIKIKFFLAEFILIGDILLTANQSGFEKYSFFLFFIDMLILIFYYPTKISKRFVFVSALTGILITISLLFLLPSASNFKIRDIAIIAFTLLFLFPLYYGKIFGIFHRIIVLSSCVLFALYFHSPYNFSENFSNIKEDEKAIIPYQFLEMGFNEDKFLYYLSDLPFENKTKLPDKKMLEGKILILSVKNQSNVISSYLKELMHGKYEFLIIQDRPENAEKFLNLQMKIAEFPLLTVYFPDYLKINLRESEFSFNQKNQSWIKNYFFPKMQNAKTNDDMVLIFDTAEKYGGTEIRNYSEKLRKIFFESYLQYCRYFFDKKEYSLVLSTSTTALKFGKFDSEITRLIYESSMKVPPDFEYAKILKYLAEIPSYRESILKRLIPALIASQNTEEALQKIDDLISFYKGLGNQGEIQSLYIEKAKIYLSQKDMTKAGELIQNELRNNPSSVSWNKLNDELNIQKEEFRQRWMTDKSKQIKITLE